MSELTIFRGGRGQWEGILRGREWSNTNQTNNSSGQVPSPLFPQFPWLPPVPNPYVTSNYGWRDMDKDGKKDDYHYGVDYRAAEGTNVYASGDGRVVKAEYNKGGYGNVIVIEHNNNGYYTYTLYAHLDSMKVRPGDTVTAGQEIGRSGNTGSLSKVPYPYHLHFEVIDNNGRQILEFENSEEGHMGIPGDEYRKDPIAYLEESMKKFLNDMLITIPSLVEAGRSTVTGNLIHVNNWLQNWFRDFRDVMNYFIFNKPIFGDPLVLDLNGDGIKTTGLSDSNAMFDLDGDKFAEKTGWISGDDGILAVDRNNNGKIDDISEVFGNQNKANGFETLREFDTNNDGVINANDTQFDQLKVWQDKNSNGWVDEGELKSLNEAGIASINLNYQNTNRGSNGNIISQLSNFTRTDGSQGIAGDVNLQLDQVITRYNGDFTLDTDVLFLPWLRGYGEVAALPISASQDSFGVREREKITNP